MGRFVKIPKGNGKFRKIYVPSRQAKKVLRKILPNLQAIAMSLDVYGVQHGFVPGRSPVTNALPHRGFRYTLKMDLQDCFDHVTRISLKSLNNIELNRIMDSKRKLMFVCAKDLSTLEIAAQGLPTSPSLCNIALSKGDFLIVTKLAGRGAYTRYADDLTLSSDSMSVLNEMELYISSMLWPVCFQTANESKTRYLDAKAGRRIITGVAVDDDIHPTREAKRKLRAARHQANSSAARGLEEWTKCKLPVKDKAISRAVEAWRLSEYKNQGYGKLAMCLGYTSS